jgi:DNA-binding transcriptional LysR family regulator
MLEMALAGTGIVRLPQFVVAEALAAGTLVSILDEFQVPPSSISLLFPAAASQLKTKAFVDAIGGELRARIRALDRR